MVRWNEGIPKMGQDKSGNPTINFYGLFELFFDIFDKALDLIDYMMV